MRTLVLLFLLLLSTFGSTAQTGPIEEAGFVEIGGIDQWVSIKGSDASKPVLLFLHGGPGSTFTPYADAIFEGWDAHFVLVHWDQRGAGKTYGSYAPDELDPDFLAANPLSLAQMVEDGIALSEHLVARLGKEKLILFGTSWGSVLGVKMATQRPDLFHAYLGHSQLVNPSETNRHSYKKLLRLLRENDDAENLQLLDSIGAPPYDQARTTGQFIRILKKYEAMAADPFPAEWGEIPEAHNTPEDIRHREEGDDYSFLHYAGDTRFGIEPISADINLQEEHFKFEIPVYLVQGEEDLLTPPEVTKAYFDKIEAPQKELILVPGAAHGFIPAVVTAIFEVLQSQVVPGIGE